MRRGAAVVVLVLLAGLLGCSRDESIEPPTAPADTSGSRAAAAQRTLEGLVSALRSGDADRASELAAPGAQDVLESAAHNARSLRLTSLAMRYVDESSPLDDSLRARYGARAWSGSVRLEYAFGGVDRQPARVETEVVFVPDGQDARIVAFGGERGRTPLWLVEDLGVVRRGSTLVAVAGGRAGRFPALASYAVRQVRRTLPGWRGPLVVEVPSSQDELDAALHAQAGEYDNIAAVTTTEDGSLAEGAPVRVFLNPRVFDGLRTRGAQVVMSHEATHVATGATFVDIPTWLSEGFADYVALDGAGVPVGVAARQILRRIRADGLPDRLPTARDLEPTATGLGATYEEAWLACRFLGQEYGRQRLLAFYRTVSDGASLDVAFRRVLRTTEREFVRRWRQDLSRLSGVPQ